MGSVIFHSIDTLLFSSIISGSKLCRDSISACDILHKPQLLHHALSSHSWNETNQAANPTMPPLRLSGMVSKEGKDGTSRERENSPQRLRRKRRRRVRAHHAWQTEMYPHSSLVC